jgi:peroxiredoxin
LRPLRRRVLIGIAAIAVVAGLYFVAHDYKRPRTAARLTQRTLAPDFSLPQLSGQQFHLSDYRGKLVLLDFWATWCDACRDEIPQFVQLQNKYRDQGLEIVGISMDDGPEPVRDFYPRFKMNYPVVIGNAATGELYGGVLGLPIAFMIDRNGRIYSKHMGATDMSVFEGEITTLLRAK